MNRRKKGISLMASVLLLGVYASSPLAHCEIPCGIYGDEMRIGMLKEHIQTVEKSMKEIERLSGEQLHNYNQIVRWVGNKEDHANEIQHIVTQYFMTQRLKPAGHADEKAHQAYLEKLALLHQMLVHAMKAKQTTDLSHVEKLRMLVDEFEKAYFEG